MVCLFDVAYAHCNTFPLQYRRLDLATNFAIKLFKSAKSLEFFEPVHKQVITRNEQLLVKEKVPNTRRCYNAPHNYLGQSPKILTLPLDGTG